jgi:hypothetical protein
MRRLLLIGLAVAALAPAAALYAVTALGAPAADGKLLGTVGPAMTISLSNSDGTPVTHLDPGTYDIEIDDRSAEHNFHLIGPGGVSAGTDIEFIGVKTVTVTLGDGQFTFLCDVHPYDMIGQFTVGTVSAPPPPPPPVNLLATVGPKKTISLTKGGSKVTKLKPGRYAVTVRDRSASLDFHLKGPGVNKKTGIAFTGKTTWKPLKLVAGQYSYYSDSHSDMRRSFRVAG